MRRLRAWFAATHPGGFGAPPAWPLRAGREELADGGRQCPREARPGAGDRLEGDGSHRRGGAPGGVRARLRRAPRLMSAELVAPSGAPPPSLSLARGGTCRKSRAPCAVGAQVHGRGPALPAARPHQPLPRTSPARSRRWRGLRMSRAALDMAGPSPVSHIPLPMKKIGFLSFGHWTPSPQSQMRTGVRRAAAVDRAGGRGRGARRRRRLLPGASLRPPARLAVSAAGGVRRADEADRDRHRGHRHALREPDLHGGGRRRRRPHRRRASAARHQPRLARAGDRRLALLRLRAGRRA